MRGFLGLGFLEDDALFRGGDDASGVIAARDLWLEDILRMLRFGLEDGIKLGARKS